MLSVYQTMPEFHKFLYNNSGQKFKEEFLTNEKYGGPFNNSIKAQGDTQIPNDITKLLNDEIKNKKNNGF